MYSAGCVGCSRSLDAEVKLDVFGCCGWFFKAIGFEVKLDVFGLLWLGVSVSIGNGG